MIEVELIMTEKEKTNLIMLIQKNKQQLGKILNTRNTPQLSFVYDSGYDHSDEIESLLKGVLPEDSITQQKIENRHKQSEIPLVHLLFVDKSKELLEDHQY